MLGINYAESSFVIRGMSEGASCLGGGGGNPKQTHKNSCKTNEDTSPAPVLSHFGCGKVTILALFGLVSPVLQ